MISLVIVGLKAVLRLPTMGKWPYSHKCQTDIGPYYLITQKALLPVKKLPLNHTELPLPFDGDGAQVIIFTLPYIKGVQGKYASVAFGKWF